jgi:MoaA/NifB/PqqE/SkfB family radical SAM enzyme
MEELSQKKYIQTIINQNKNYFTYVHLLLTEQCNFYCEHCMYDCGPNKPSDYMSDDVLYKVKQQVDFLTKFKIPVVLNLIGGEPTLNFDKFEHIFKETSKWDCSLVMTSNAWWIQSEKLTKRFFNIVKDKVISLEKTDKERVTSNRFFNIRLSTDSYHDKQRKIKDLEGRLFDIINQLNLPKVTKEFRWISTQNQDYMDLGQTSVIWPNGRGRKESALKQYLRKCNLPERTCFCDNSFAQIHYLPNGEIADACGRGSIYNFGTIDDNILFIMGLILKYKEERFYGIKDYNCYNCREMVRKWKMDRLEDVRTRFSKFNTMDYEEFIHALTA